MSLPKIQYPLLSFTSPSDKKAYSFRPMLVREEKLLLLAKSSQDPTDILTAIKQVVNNCSLDPTLNIDKLPLYALEYLFIRIRGSSIGDEINVSYKDFGDEKVYDFTIDIKDIAINYPELVKPIIEITPTSGLVLKYPSADIYDDKDFLNVDSDEAFYHLVVRCIESIYDGDTVYEGKDFSEADILEFIELIDIASFDKIRLFMNSFPTLYYKLEYTNSKNEKKVIELKTLSDFFTLR